MIAMQAMGENVVQAAQEFARVLAEQHQGSKQDASLATPVYFDILGKVMASPIHSAQSALQLLKTADPFHLQHWRHSLLQQQLAGKSIKPKWHCLAPKSRLPFHVGACPTVMPLRRLQLPSPMRAAAA